jgi:hypothetical protein
MGLHFTINDEIPPGFVIQFNTITYMIVESRSDFINASFEI